MRITLVTSNLKTQFQPKDNREISKSLHKTQQRCKSLVGIDIQPVAPTLPHQSIATKREMRVTHVNFKLSDDTPSASHRHIMPLPQSKRSSRAPTNLITSAHQRKSRAAESAMPSETQKRSGSYPCKFQISLKMPQPEDKEKIQNLHETIARYIDEDLAQQSRPCHQKPKREVEVTHVNSKSL